MRTRRANYTQEEKQKYFDQMNEMRAQGIGYREAEKKIGLNKNAYYVFKKSLGGYLKPKTVVKRRRRSEPFVVQVPTRTQSRLACVVGTPDELIAFVRGLS